MTDRPAITTRAATWTLVVGCLAQAMLTINSTTTSVAIPSIQRDLHANALQLAWIQNAYVLAVAALMPLCGAIGDRYGRKKVYLAGFAVFTLGSLLSALAPGPWFLVFTRALQGTGGAAMGALGLSLLAIAFGERLGQATGIWAASSAVGLTLGPLIGGILVDTVGWRSVFFVNVPICLVAVIPAIRFIPESRDLRRQSVDALGGGLLAGSLIGLVATLHSLHFGSGYNPVETLVPGVLMVVFVLTFFWRERRTSDPVLPLSLFSRPRFRAAVIIALSVNFAIAGTLYFQSLTMQNNRGWSALSAGFLLLPLNAGIAFGGLRSSRLVARFGVAAVTATALFGAAAGAICLIPMGFGASAVLIGLADVLIGLGLGLAFPGVSAAGMHEVDLRNIGVASATLSDGRQVGGSIGIAVLVAVMVATTNAVWSHSGSAAGVTGPQLVAAQSDIDVGNVAAVGHNLGNTAQQAAQHSFGWGIAALYLTSAVLLFLTACFALVSLRASREPAPTAADSSPARRRRRPGEPAPRRRKHQPLDVGLLEDPRARRCPGLRGSADAGPGRGARAARAGGLGPSGGLRSRSRLPVTTASYHRLGRIALRGFGGLRFPRARIASGAAPARRDPRSAQVEPDDGVVGRVVAGDDDVGHVGETLRVFETGRLGLGTFGARGGVGDRRPLGDEVPVALQPPPVVEGHRPHDAPVGGIGSGESGRGRIALDDADLVPQSRDADGLDVDPELQ